MSWRNCQANMCPCAARVWNDSPEVFSRGAGMARFFGPNRIALQHTLLVSLSFGVPSCL